jgi:hypothetical protein
MVPGKSLAIIALTGHVWHPMGNPSGLALSIPALAERNPATAALAAAFFKKSRREIADMGTSLRFESDRVLFSRSTVLSHDSRAMIECCKYPGCRVNHPACESAGWRRSARRAGIETISG